MSGPRFGATGRFPRGRLSPHDEGELRLGIADDGRGCVRIEFGTPVAWIALSYSEAVTFARLILKNAGAKKVEIEL